MFPQFGSVVFGWRDLQRLSGWRKGSQILEFLSIFGFFLQIQYSLFFPFLVSLYSNLTSIEQCRNTILTVMGLLDLRRFEGFAIYIIACYVFRDCRYEGFILCVFFYVLYSNLTSMYCVRI